jgi:hypothetical protein
MRLTQKEVRIPVRFEARNLFDDLFARGVSDMYDDMREYFADMLDAATFPLEENHTAFLYIRHGVPVIERRDGYLVFVYGGYPMDDEGKELGDEGEVTFYIKGTKIEKAVYQSF